MKKQISRVPTDLLDDLSIYCYLLSQNNLNQNEVAKIIGKDRTTVIYHLQRYSDKSMFSKYFQRRIKNFSESKFIKEYKKTGKMNPFFNGILELPEKEDKDGNLKYLMRLVSGFDAIQMQKIINYCQVIGS